MFDEVQLLITHAAEWFKDNDHVKIVATIVGCWIALVGGTKTATKLKTHAKSGYAWMTKPAALGPVAKVLLDRLSMPGWKPTEYTRRGSPHRAMTQTPPGLPEIVVVLFGGGNVALFIDDDDVLVDGTLRSPGMSAAAAKRDRKAVEAAYAKFLLDAMHQQFMAKITSKKETQTAQGVPASVPTNAAAVTVTPPDGGRQTVYGNGYVTTDLPNPQADGEAYKNNVVWVYRNMMAPLLCADGVSRSHFKYVGFVRKPATCATDNALDRFKDMTAVLQETFATLTHPELKGRPVYLWYGRDGGLPGLPGWTGETVHISPPSATLG